MRYAHQGGHNPPVVVVHGNATFGSGFLARLHGEKLLAPSQAEAALREARPA